MCSFDFLIVTDIEKIYAVDNIQNPHTIQAKIIDTLSNYFDNAFCLATDLSRVCEFLFRLKIHESNQS